MRRIRMLVAVGSLIAYPAMAWAECAWVLWVRVRDVKFNESRWISLSAFPEFHACNMELASAISKHEGAREANAHFGVRRWLVFERHWIAERYECFPDTMRPQ